VTSLDLLSKNLLNMDLRFDTLLYCNLGNENSVAGRIKFSRGPQVLQPCTTRLIDRMLGRCWCLIVVLV